MIDLHMHSLYSDDGEFTPAQLVEQCAAQGIVVMSITDHNCARANEEAQTMAVSKGMDYIPGIELDCVYKACNFHMLGYGIDFRSADFEAIEQKIRVQSLDVSLEHLQKTQALGFCVTEADMRSLSKGRYWAEIWNGEMFAEVLLAKPEYMDHPLLQPYRMGGARSDAPFVNFYWDFYAQGKPCHVKMDYPSMEHMIDIIHQNHGCAVLAHPGINLKGRQGLLDDILKLDVDGIEAFSSYHSPEQASYYCHAAKGKGLFVTCGSDFHGKIKPRVEIGKHGCLISADEMQREILKHRI